MTVPAACFSYFDSSGKTLDLAQRPEMQYGSVEFISPPDEVWSQVPPVYLFLIDVSINAVRSGMLEVSALAGLFGFIYLLAQQSKPGLTF